MCALGIDARRRSARSLVERALTSRWIAANLCAIRGIAVERRTGGARVVGVHADDLMHLCAELAAGPSLVDGTLLPVTWRAALRGLGVPVLDRPVEHALAAGVSVVVP